MTRSVRATEDKFMSMARHMNKWVDKVLGQGYHRFCPTEAWSPAVNFYEFRSHYCAVVDLAGMRAEDIDLRVEEKKDMMVISGHRPSPGLPEAEGDVNFHLMEIDHGRFCRTVELPADADSNAIQATYRNGFLWVHIPKTV